ncbi:MAG: mandelate racemase/muconate lactonizing enzyme family protein, partial [Mesorhizobium sp.]
DSYVRLPNGAKSIVEDGHIAVPDVPGIGVELNMDGVHKHAVPGFGIFE